MERLKKYKKEKGKKKYKKKTVEYFLELYPNMDKVDFEATFKNEAKNRLVKCLIFLTVNWKIKLKKNKRDKYSYKLYRRT